jgi:hypothetical protein
VYKRKHAHTETKKLSAYNGQTGMYYLLNVSTDRRQEDGRGRGAASALRSGKEKREKERNITRTARAIGPTRTHNNNNNNNTRTCYGYKILVLVWLRNFRDTMRFVLFFIFINT